MATYPTATNINNASVSNQSWSLQFGVKTVVTDATNPNYPRLVMLDNNSVTVQKIVNGVFQIFQFPISTLTAYAIQQAPLLSWPPVITAGPNAVLNAVPTAAAAFSINANAELPITYQWEVSNNGGTNFSNVSNGGIYSNATTNTLNISNGNGLNGFVYQCVATDNSGSTTSNMAGILTDPSIATQPSNVSVTAPAAASFTIVANGNTSLSYQWAESNDSGTTYSNLANAGVFSNVTTNSMNISNSTGLNGKYFHCFAIDSNGHAISNAGVLTVT